MTTNRQYVERATLVVQDLINNGGYLNPEQDAAFIRTLRISPTMLREARSVVMMNPTKEINKIEFQSMILKPSQGEGVELGSSNRSKPTTSKVELVTKKLMAEVNLTYEDLEDNIERGNIGEHREGGSPAAGGGLMQTVLDLMADRVAEDSENYALNAISGGSYADAVLNYDNGWLALADAGTHFVDAAGVSLSKEVFKHGLMELPSQYKRRRSGLRNYVSDNQEIEYRNTVADRATAAGDAALNGLPAIFAHGVPITPVAYMPEDTGLLCDPQNLIWGIQRRFLMEIDKIIREQLIVVVVSMRVDIQIQELDALVKYRNIGDPL